MSARRNPPKHTLTDPSTTHLDVDAAAWGRISVAGPALAVIALVALLGMILVCWKVLELSERAMPPASTPAVEPTQRAALPPPQPSQYPP